MAYAPVQAASNGGNGVSTLNITVSVPTNGNTLFVFTSCDSSTTTVSSVTLTGATFTQLNSKVVNSARTFEIWKATNVSSVSGTTCTVTWSAAQGSACVFVETSGMGATTVTDKDITNFDSSGLTLSATTTTTATTTKATEAWFSLFKGSILATTGSSTFSAPTAGYTIAAQPGYTTGAGAARANHSFAVCYIYVTATGAAGNACTIALGEGYEAWATSIYGDQGVLVKDVIMGGGIIPFAR